MGTTGEDLVVLGIHAEQSSLPIVTPHYETRDPSALGGWPGRGPTCRKPALLL